MLIFMYDCFFCESSRDCPDDGQVIFFLLKEAQPGQTGILEMLQDIVEKLVWVVDGAVIV